jgi:hypothetical protein
MRSHGFRQESGGRVADREVASDTDFDPRITSTTSGGIKEAVRLV